MRVCACSVEVFMSVLVLVRFYMSIFLCRVSTSRSIEYRRVYVGVQTYITFTYQTHQASAAERKSWYD